MERYELHYFCLNKNSWKDDYFGCRKEQIMKFKTFKEAKEYLDITEDDKSYILDLVNNKKFYKNESIR